jgi:hypothetical protein
MKTLMKALIAVALVALPVSMALAGGKACESCCKAKGKCSDCAKCADGKCAECCVEKK